MQGRSAIQKDRVTLGNFVEDVPDLGSLALNEFFRAAYGVDMTLFLEAAYDEGLKQEQAPSSSADRIGAA